MVNYLDDHEVFIRAAKKIEEAVLKLLGSFEFDHGRPGNGSNST